MPTEQLGTLQKEKRGGNWTARWHDEHGKRRAKSGFATKTAARAFLKTTIEQVAGLRSGHLLPVEHRPQTVNALLDTFEVRHGALLDPLTLRTMRSQSRHARRTFGGRHPDSLNRLELEDAVLQDAEFEDHESDKYNDRDDNCRPANVAIPRVLRGRRRDRTRRLQSVGVIRSSDELIQMVGEFAHSPCGFFELGVRVL
jgi:hypothetical protein